MISYDEILKYNTYILSIVLSFLVVILKTSPRNKYYLGIVYISELSIIICMVQEKFNIVPTAILGCILAYVYIKIRKSV